MQKVRYALALCKAKISCFSFLNTDNAISKSSVYNYIKTDGSLGNIEFDITHTVHRPDSLSIVRAEQKISSFGSIQVEPGKYFVVGSAKHSTNGGICKICINTNQSQAPSDNGQSIYGYAGYDVNTGCVNAIIDLNEKSNIYFLVWAESDFEITPMSFYAIKL